jgi:membrane-associated phospholipid phosphatase
MRQAMPQFPADWKDFRTRKDVGPFSVFGIGDFGIARDDKRNTMTDLRRSVPISSLAPLWLAAAAAAVCAWDQPLSEWMQAARWPGDVRKGLMLCEAFGHGLTAAVILTAVVVLVRPRLSTCLLYVAAVYGPGLAVNGLKCGIGRWRPHAWRELLATGTEATWPGLFPAWNSDAGIELGHAIQSFPSGHAATAAGLAVILTHVAPRGRWFFAGLALAACVQRIAAGAHWPSDVLAGAAIGVLTAQLIVRYTLRA